MFTCVKFRVEVFSWFVAIFVRLIFEVRLLHENLLTTNISQYTVHVHKHLTDYVNLLGQSIEQVDVSCFECDWIWCKHTNGFVAG